MSGLRTFLTFNRPGTQPILVTAFGEIPMQLKDAHTYIMGKHAKWWQWRKLYAARKVERKYEQLAWEKTHGS